MNPTIHTIDASGKSLGRVASQAAHLLMEKGTPAFEKHRKLGVRVAVVNAGKLVITEKRAKGTVYKSYSGYPGHLKIVDLKALREKHGIGEVVARAVKGMLPNNRLRPAMLKRLTVSE